MKIHFRTILLFITAISTLTSCDLEKHKAIKEANAGSLEKLQVALGQMVFFEKVNMDSVIKVYEAIAEDDTAARTRFAAGWRARADVVCARGQAAEDSLKREREKEANAEQAAREVEWAKANPKAAAIKRKHPDWDNEDCERIADNRIWIGMTLDMLKCQRGLPNTATPSNYGNGNQWQWCWYDYSPSCFYGGDDEVITAYN